MTDNQKIQSLKEYFTKRDDVAMAFLFGSRAKGYARSSSDWDIGVYFTPLTARELEFEIDRDIPALHSVWGDVERIVGAEVDIVTLNRAAARVAWSIVRAGIPLTIKNRHQYLLFLLKASYEANMWYHTAHDYYRVFQRSASLSEEDRARLEKAIQFLEVEASDYPKFQQLTWERYSMDRSSKRDIERWAEQLMNAVIDVAEIVLASERRVIPETYKEILQTLQIVPPFDQGDMCSYLAAQAGLRNILAHEYLDYRWKELQDFLEGSGPFIHAFIAAIKTFLEKAPPAP